MPGPGERVVITRRGRLLRGAALAVGLVVLVVGVVGGLRAVGSWTDGGRTATLAVPAPVGSAQPEATPTPSAADATPSPSPSATADTRDGDPAAGRTEIDAKGSGKFHEISTDRAAPKGSGQVLHYDVRMEKGLPFDRAATIATIQDILTDRRSWTGEGRFRFAQVESAGRADFTIYLATPGTTDDLCAPLLTGGEVSCQTGNRVVLNAKRWAFGAKAYGDDVESYRIYLVNHEVGHRLGHGHVGCPHQGDRAPVMMQQTKGLQGCRANPWPHPKRS